MGQTEGMVIPRCAASATWNPHVDVKGREDAVDVKGLEDDATERTWRQYRVQARDEVGGRAEHMVTPRRAASATWNPQCEEGAGRG